MFLKGPRRIGNIGLKRATALVTAGAISISACAPGVRRHIQKETHFLKPIERKVDQKQIQRERVDNNIKRYELGLIELMPSAKERELKDALDEDYHSIRDYAKAERRRPIHVLEERYFPVKGALQLYIKAIEANEMNYLARTRFAELLMKTIGVFKESSFFNMNRKQVIDRVHKELVISLAINPNHKLTHSILIKLYTNFNITTVLPKERLIQLHKSILERLKDPDIFQRIIKAVGN